MDKEAFMEWADEEEATRLLFSNRGIADFTMLKYEKNKKTFRLSLHDLAKKLDAGEKVGRDDWGGCGCSVQYDTLPTSPYTEGEWV